MRKQEGRGWEGKQRDRRKIFFTFAQGSAVCYVISCHYFLSERMGTASLQVSWVNCAVCLSPAKNLLSPHQNKQLPSGLKRQKQPVKIESNKSLLLSLFIPTSQQFSIYDIFPFFWQYTAQLPTTHIHRVQTRIKRLLPSVKTTTNSAVDRLDRHVTDEGH